MLLQNLLTLVEDMLEGLCGEATELALGRHLALVPKSKVGIGWKGVNSSIVHEPHLTVWERRDSHWPVGEVTVHAEQLILNSKFG